MDTVKLKVGTKVTVEMEDGEKYTSVIQNVDDIGEDIYVNVVTKQGETHLPEEGSYIKLMAQTKTCGYLMFGVVENYVRLDSVKVMHFVRKGEVERIQRRESFRLEKSIPIDLRMYNLYDINRVEKSVTIAAADISEGGVGFHWPVPIEIDRFLDCGIDIEGEYFLMRCRVVRCIKEDERVYRIGLEIIEEDEEFRNKIRKFIFEQQTK